MVETSTTYRSPVRLVLHAGEATSSYSPQLFNRVRKKLMAEIALSGDEIIIDDVSYTRNDAATLLENLSEEAWRVHCLIYSFPGLLHFLEKQVFENNELKKADAYLYDQRFVKVVSPYFAYSFNVLSGALIRQEAFEELVQLMNYQGYLLPDHRHEAFQKIRNYLDELSYTLRNLSWEKFIADESILYFVFSDEWRRSINALPTLFNTLRDEIVGHLIEIVLRFQQKATWYYLHEVLVQLRGIETNDYNRHEIERIDKVIYANTKLEGKNGKPKKDDEISTGRIIWWGVWIVLMIVRMATCNEKSSRNYDFSDYTYRGTQPEGGINNFTEKKNEKILLQQLDSLLTDKKRTTRTAAVKSGDPAFSFSDDPKAARNDSLLVVNKTPYDAVFFYFKDIPGHSMSGRLPKLYSALIKKGETLRVFVLPGNGRVYFAFGEGWGELAKGIKLQFPDYMGKTGILEATPETLELNYFFSSGKKPEQKYLLHPLYIEPFGVTHDPAAYHYLNKNPRSLDTKETVLRLLSSNGEITAEVQGRLTVKEEWIRKSEAAVPGAGISIEQN